MKMYLFLLDTLATLRRIFRMIKKFTTGYVDQYFDDNGDLISQEFVADNFSIYEDGEGNTLDKDHPGNDFYAPFDMI